MEMKLANFKEVHLYLSSLANVIGIFATLLLFYSWGSKQEFSEIGTFAILSSGYFLASQIATFGVDLSILSGKDLDLKGRIAIDNRFLFGFLAFIINAIVFFPVIYFDFLASQGISNLNIFLIWAASSMYVINQVTMAFIQRAELLNLNSIIYASKHLGFLLGAILILFTDQVIGLFFLSGEIIALTSSLVYCTTNFKNIIYRADNLFKLYKKSYFFSGFSQFTYSGLFKVDTFVLFFIADLRTLGVYSILSAVCEGLINFKTAFHPAIHNYFRKCIYSHEQVDTSSSVKKIYIISRYIGVSILPAYIILHLVMFTSIPVIDMVLGAIALALTLTFTNKLFLHYFFFSILGQPKRQLIFSILIIVCNALLDIVLYQMMGLFGIALATSLSYFIFHLILMLFTKEYLSD